MTPVEVSEMIDGALWRRSQRWDLAAWVTANLMNVSGKVVKKTIKPNQLLGKRPKPKFHEVRDVKKDFEELIRRQEAINAKTAN